MSRAGPGEPTKAEILGRRERTGATVSDLVDHFWANADELTRARAFQRVKKMVQRAEAAPSAAGPQRRVGDDRSNRADDGGTMLPRPEPDFDTARMDRVPFLELHLAELLADLAWVRSAGLVGRIGPLAALVLNARDELDRARTERGAVVQLERSPAAVAAEVERRRKALEILAKAHERREAKDRDL